MKACFISFSGRSGGNCSNIAKMLQQQWTEQNTVAVYDFSTFTITPCGNCRCECFQERENCPYFHDLEFSICDTITNSDFVCFIVPNYCDYPCANFYAFNERSQCYFQNHPDLLNQYLAVRKKFIVVSNTGQDNFTTAFRYHIAEDLEPDVLFLSAKRFHKISINGDLMDSKEAQEATLLIPPKIPYLRRGNTCCQFT